MFVLHGKCIDISDTKKKNSGYKKVKISYKREISTFNNTKKTKFDSVVWCICPEELTELITPNQNVSLEVNISAQKNSSFLNIFVQNVLD